MNPRSVLAVTLAIIPQVLAAQGRRPGRPATPAAVPAPVAVSSARYQVRIDPAADVFEVRAEFGFPSGRDTVLLSLPSWTTGSYGTENYARYVHAARAEADGRPAAWDKFDKDTWRIVAGGARTVALVFRTNPDSLDLSQSRIEPDFAFFNGTNLLVYPEGSDLRFGAEVSVEAPAGWRLATGLREAAPGRWSAADYHDLVDAPFFAGRLWIDSVVVDGRPIRLVVHPESAMTAVVWDSMAHYIRAIVATQNRIFGGPPYDSYTILFAVPFIDLPFGGGLEHHNSQFDALPGAYFADRRTGRLGDFTGSLLSHEFFHLFNVKRIRPAELWPYDYGREQYTPLLWWSEGVTDYYGDLAMARAGLWSRQRFLASITSNIQSVEGASEIVAVEDASINTWIKPTVVDEGQYYYPKGSLLGLMLDIRIREATGNRQSLDDVMRLLWAEHWLKARGFTTQDLLGYLRRWDPGVDDFYARYINGREPLPYQEILPRAGLAVNVRESRLPFIGVRVGEAQGGGVVVEGVEAASPAAEAGLMPGDLLLRVGEVETSSPETFGMLYRRRYAGAEGQSIEISWRRSGQAMSGRAAVRMRVNRTITVSEDASAGEAAKALLAGMLGR